MPKQPSPVSTASPYILSRHCGNCAGIKDGPIMATQNNVGQSMLFHHNWHFYSIFTGRSHTQRCELWMILIKCSCSPCERVFVCLDLNGLPSDTVGCSVQSVPAVRNTRPFSLISSDTQTAPTKTQMHTYATANCLHLKMSINICVCMHSLILWKEKTHHIICTTVLWMIIYRHNLMSDMAITL